jgi:hypothetical protein
VAGRHDTHKNTPPVVQVIVNLLFFFRTEAIFTVPIRTTGATGASMRHKAVKLKGFGVVLGKTTRASGTLSSMAPIAASTGHGWI